ncbi:MAG TPA: type VI secretion system tube protein Hcp [Nitrosopumilaceae archaeon]|nr:type VI secretion system tube protein Hcp [Nitrosopumilaceae archaeon]
MKNSFIIIAALLGLILVGSSNSFAVTSTPTPLSAGDPIYMNYDNLSIKGEVTATGHQDWIELNSFQWGVGRTISSPTSGSGDRQGSAPSVSEIVVTKVMDKSSPSLLQQALAGEGKPVVIDLVKVNNGNLVVYAQYKLENVLISGYSVSSGGDRPSESISLSFTKITFIFNSQNPDGTLAPSQVTYDLALAKVS